MTGSDPRRQLRTGGRWDRMDRPPGWADSLFAGRSHADREADQDAMLRVLLVLGGIAVLLIVALNALFTMVGLQLGWWSAPAFAPLLFWSFACAVSNRVLRPVEIDVLSWRHRLAVAGMLAVTMWLVWPLWAGPTAKAWKAAHGGITAVFGPRYPLGAVLGSSPIAMGLVAFLLLAIGMLLAPRIRPREPRYTPPPGGPEPLRSPLATPPVQTLPAGPPILRAGHDRAAAHAHQLRRVYGRGTVGDPCAQRSATGRPGARTSAARRARGPVDRPSRRSVDRRDARVGRTDHGRCAAHPGGLRGDRRGSAEGGQDAQGDRADTGVLGRDPRSSPRPRATSCRAPRIARGWVRSRCMTRPGRSAARRSVSASRRCRGVRRGMARLRSPPRCSRRPPRMRASVMASTSRSPHARCWRRCFMRRRCRTAGSTRHVDGWGVRSSLSPRRSSAARARRSRLRSFPGSLRRPSGTTAPVCSGRRRSRSRGRPVSRSERPPTRPYPAARPRRADRPTGHAVCRLAVAYSGGARAADRRLVGWVVRARDRPRDHLTHRAS